MTDARRPLRLILDGDALVQNWRTLAMASGSAATGAAVKANGYGLGANEVAKRLYAAGCRDFLVANWAEAEALVGVVPADRISVLNGVGEGDVEFAKTLGAIPVLNTPLQIQRWKSSGGGRCHVMLDSGINRLGIGPEQLNADLFRGLDIDILLSHLASADDDVPQNEAQLALFLEMSKNIACQRRSLANSAGIQLGSKYHFDLTRPGISLYGGIVREELAQEIQQVVRIEAQVLQVRELKKGDPVGYNATYVCPRDMRVATIAIGYADGYLRGFSGTGTCLYHGKTLPVMGRVSMDLVSIDVTDTTISGGIWIEVSYQLSSAAAASGLSQYELLVLLGNRYDRSFE